MLNVINPRRCCLNLQAMWHIISTWPNNRSRGLKLLSILPKMSSVVGCTCSDERLISRRNATEVVE